MSLHEYANNYPISLAQPNHKQILTKMLKLCRQNRRFLCIIWYVNRAYPSVLEKFPASESAGFGVHASSSLLCVVSKE